MSIPRSQLKQVADALEQMSRVVNNVQEAPTVFQKAQDVLNGLSIPEIEIELSRKSIPTIDQISRACEVLHSVERLDLEAQVKILLDQIRNFSASNFESQLKSVFQNADQQLAGEAERKDQAFPDKDFPDDKVLYATDNLVQDFIESILRQNCFATIHHHLDSEIKQKSVDSNFIDRALIYLLKGKRNKLKSKPSLGLKASDERNIEKMFTNYRGRLKLNLSRMDIVAQRQWLYGQIAVCAQKIEKKIYELNSIHEVRAKANNDDFVKEFNEKHAIEIDDTVGYRYDTDALIAQHKTFMKFTEYKTNDIEKTIFDDLLVEYMFYQNLNRELGNDANLVELIDDFYQLEKYQGVSVEIFRQRQDLRKKDLATLIEDLKLRSFQ